MDSFFRTPCFSKKLEIKKRIVQGCFNFGMIGQVTAVFLFNSNNTTTALYVSCTIIISMDFSYYYRLMFFLLAYLLKWKKIQNTIARESTRIDGREKWYYFVLSFSIFSPPHSTLNISSVYTLLFSVFMCIVFAFLLSLSSTKSYIRKSNTSSTFIHFAQSIFLIDRVMFIKYI